MQPFFAEGDKKALNLWDDNVGTTEFNVLTKDNELAGTMEDKEFLKTMSKELYQGNSNSWVATLPFRTSRRKLPNKVQDA